MADIKVFLVDDHKLFRAGLIEILRDEEGLEVVGVASDSDETMERVKDRVPDVILMDIDFGPGKGEEGVEITRRIKREYGQRIRIIILSMHDDESLRYKAFRAGARAYVLKTDDPQELILKIKETS